MGHRAFKRDVRKRKAKERVKDVVLLSLAALTAAFVARVLDQSGSPAGATANRPGTGVVASPAPAASRVAERAAPTAAITGLAAVDSKVAVRYTGDGGCDSKHARVERTVDGGRTWRPVITNVAHPTGIAVAGRFVLLTGRDARCAWLTEYSVDQGRGMVPAAVRLESTALAIGANAWSVDDQGRLLRGSDGLASVAQREVGCAAKSTPAYVAARGNRVWVVCRGGRTPSGTEARLVLASRDGGATWSPVSGAANGAPGRPDGLDGVGALDGFGFSDETHGWVLLRGTGRCTGNDADLRVTGDGGRNWTALPCVPTRIAAKVRSVSFGDPLHAMLLADTPNGLATIVTNDGGATWGSAAR